MAALSSLTQNRVQSLVGSVDAAIPGEFAIFALDRSKRAIVDFIPATAATIVIWTTLINPGTWSVFQIPLLVLLVAGVYLFGEGGLF